MDFGFVKKENSHFLDVSAESIAILEKHLNARIPRELSIFYETIGYGFLDVKKFNINRVMDPISVLEFRTRTGDYEHYPYIEGYEKYEENKIVFFEQNESAYLSIELTENENARVYYYDTVIAKSLYEFFSNMVEDDRYYLELYEDE